MWLMEREIAKAQRQLVLLKSQRNQVEIEIGLLQQQRQDLRKSVQENLVVLQRIRELLESSAADLLG